MQDRGPAAYLAEFLGTFALVFFITMVVSLFVAGPVEPSPTGVAPVDPFIDWSVIGLVHVFVLFMLIQTLAVVCGAHFNPAVTLAMTVLRQIKPPDAAIYIVVQLAAAVAATLLTKYLLDNFPNAEAVNYGATLVSDRLGEETFLGLLCEALGTFFLVWAIVGVAVNPRGSTEWAALVIAGTLGLGVMVMGSLTGAGFNPARSFGPALVSDDGLGAGKFLLVYVLGPCVGALAAAVTYSALFMQEGKKGAEGMEPVG